MSHSMLMTLLLSPLQFVDSLLSQGTETQGSPCRLQLTEDQGVEEHLEGVNA